METEKTSNVIPFARSLGASALILSDTEPAAELVIPDFNLSGDEARFLKLSRHYAAVAIYYAPDAHPKWLDAAFDLPKSYLAGREPHVYDTDDHLTLRFRIFPEEFDETKFAHFGWDIAYRLGVGVRGASVRTLMVKTSETGEVED